MDRVPGVLRDAVPGLAPLPCESGEAWGRQSKRQHIPHAYMIYCLNPREVKRDCWKDGVKIQQRLA